LFFHGEVESEWCEANLTVHFKIVISKSVLSGASSIALTIPTKQQGSVNWQASLSAERNLLFCPAKKGDPRKPTLLPRYQFGGENGTCFTTLYFQLAQGDGAKRAISTY
jgi:hypothetical protein